MLECPPLDTHTCAQYNLMSVTIMLLTPYLFHCSRSVRWQARWSGLWFLFYHSISHYSLCCTCNVRRNLPQNSQLRIVKLSRYKAASVSMHCHEEMKVKTPYVISTLCHKGAVKDNFMFRHPILLWNRTPLPTRLTTCCASK